MTTVIVRCVLVLPCALALLLPAAASAAPTGLVAGYGFEDDSGTTVADSSAEGNGGTVSGATRTAAGQFGRALSFDAVDDVVSVPDSNSLDLRAGMTLEAWLKPSQLGSTWRTAILKEKPGDLVYALYANTSSGRPARPTSAATARSPAAPACP